MSEGPRISTRLTSAIVLLVVLTAGTVGYLGYRSVAEVAIPRTLVRIDANARARAVDLADTVRGARADVHGFRRIVGIDEIIGLSRDPSVASAGGQTLAQWRNRIASRLAAELEAKPYLLQYRIIGLADQGREFIRVERLDGVGVRVVPDAELQRKGDTTYFKRTVAAPDGAIVISPVELNREYGEVQTPHVPVIRISTPLFAADGSRFGMLIANIDLRSAFAEMSDAANPYAKLYVVNDHGEYLVDPDRGRGFGFEFGKASRIQDDFPSLASAVASGQRDAEIAGDHTGEQFAIAFAAVRVQGIVPMSVIEVVPESKIVAVLHTAARDSILLGGSAATLAAVLLAFLLTRTLTRPLSQMTAAAANFAAGKPVQLPVQAGGEIGVLARAFDMMARDVSTKAAALQHEKDTFESIMTTMAECVLLLDRNGNIIYANRANQDLLGSLNVTGTEWRDLYDILLPDGVTLLPPEQWPTARALRGETVDNYELIYRRRESGKTVHVMGSARPIWDAAGTQTGAVVVFRDVTELRATERKLHQSQKLEAIGQLTGGVAHDFNNMLTVITGTAEILIEDLGDRPELANLAKMIAQAADRGADLTRHLLAFARKQPLQPSNVNVNAMVLGVQQLLRPTLGEHIEIEAMLEDDAEPAHIDPSQLSAALLNLAVNARDAMPNGGKLMIETGNVVLDDSYAHDNPDVRPGAYVMIAVSDTGIGIPANLRDKVFDPFFTTKEVGKGTGLGLSMVYGFVKQSNGHIKIYSEEGHGTTIRLYLPRADVKAETTAVASPIAGGSETIIVVEDDSLVRDFVVTRLRSLGYQTIAVSDGRAALKLVEDGVPFDLLFTDMIMPGGLNGRQLAEAAARHRPIKVLYTSGYTENAIVHHGRLDAGVLLLPKPYRKLDLARMVRIALQSKPIMAARDIDQPPAIAATG
ncbi:MAG: response regulator [Rhodopseudomonas sp.]|uniref:ATP-binding protein n=1 Tax=Rhodopseudomonas sp. TaxID=1078 RepID=UPI0017D29A2A|nr:ATP-binding protein [Rhodopseudomonas sp.]NVN84447.1 response regulator [Rhodopseudomonas sp.]